MKRRATRAAAGVVLAAIVSIGALAFAQRLDPRRPRTLVVGTAAGPAPADRVDARRTGFSRAPLPSGTLRIAWRRSLGLTVDHAPLVQADGSVVIVTSRGDIVVLDPDGNERSHTAVGSSAVGGGAILADGTLVFVTGAGEAVGVRLGAVRFRTRLGGERAAAGSRVSPLPLEDGGVVVATATDLTALDSEGNPRARATFPEPIAAPPLLALDRVVVVTVGGTVYTWSPGREPIRAGSFGGSVDGNAALEGAHTLLAIVDGAQLAELDLIRGVTVARAAAAASGATYFLGPPALRGRSASFLGITPTRTFVLSVDAAGQETLRQGIAIASAPLLADGGAPALTLPPHVGPLVDARGVVAFAAPDGQVGVVTPDGALDVLGDPLCSRSSAGAGGAASLATARNPGFFAGIAPSGPSAFVVACESGVIARLTAEAR